MSWNDREDGHPALGTDEAFKAMTGGLDRQWRMDDPIHELLEMLAVADLLRDNGLHLEHRRLIGISLDCRLRWFMSENPRLYADDFDVRDKCDDLCALMVAERFGGPDR